MNICLFVNHIAIFAYFLTLDNRKPPLAYLLHK